MTPQEQNSGDRLRIAEVNLGEDESTLDTDPESFQEQQELRDRDLATGNKLSGKAGLRDE